MIVLLPRGAYAAGHIIELDSGEVHHLRVRRAGPAEPVDIRNGEGLIGSGELLTSGKRVSVRVDQARQVPPPPSLRLAVATGDRERFGWLAEKAAELAVTSIQPVETARSRGVATRTGAAHLEKLARRALEATKQSGAAWAPAIEPVCELGELTVGAAECRWLADVDGVWPSSLAPERPATVLVGPEGGLTDQERAGLLEAGWTPVRLSGSVLRFETAAIVAAAAIGLARGRGDHD